MWAVIRIGTQASSLAAIHMTARAFVLAEFVASLSWQLVTYFFPPVASRTPLTALLSLIIHACILIPYTALERRHFRRGDIPPLSSSALWTGLSITVATFAMSNLSFATTGTPFSGRMGPEIFYIRTLIDLCGLVALYAQLEHVLEIRSATELASIEGTLRAQHNQYLQSKANIEAIGRANHDLKHQIALIRAEVDPDRTLEHFEELEHSVAALDQQYHSGNPVLDVILSAKAQTYASEHITLTIVADGTLLNAMSSLDIATLFGNALDNAIEASRKVRSHEKRLITVALHRRGEMTVIRVENWYDTTLSCNEDGDLVTTKKDRAHHGYGVKSIRWTAHKYGGEVTTTPKTTGLPSPSSCPPQNATRAPATPRTFSPPHEADASTHPLCSLIPHDIPMYPEIP